MAGFPQQPTVQGALSESGRDAVAKQEPGLILTAVPQKTPCWSHSQHWNHEDSLRPPYKWYGDRKQH